jgi:hypothetical protein
MAHKDRRPKLMLQHGCSGKQAKLKQAEYIICDAAQRLTCTRYRTLHSSRTKASSRGKHDECGALGVSQLHEGKAGTCQIDTSNSAEHHGMCKG